MKNYTLEINSHEDFELVTDWFEREEIKELFAKQVDKVEDKLEGLSKIIELEFDRIDNHRFNLNLPRFYRIHHLLGSIEELLNNDICYLNLETEEA